MKNDPIIYILLMLGSITVAGFSQILLKRSAVDRAGKGFWQRYLNAPVILAYGMFALSTVFSTLAYRGLPLSATPVFNAMSQLLVACLAWVFFKEKPKGRRLAGLLVITAGIIIFAI